MGHLTEDRTPEGPRLGGAAAFAGLLAHRFGTPVTILTAFDVAFPCLDPLAGIAIRRLPSAERTRFENRYLADGSRRQTIRSRAAVLPEPAIRRAVEALPPGSAVLYAPVADELGGAAPLPRPPGPGAFAAVAAQGLLRRWDTRGRIRVRWSPDIVERIARLDLVSLSETELPERARLPLPMVAVTRGRRGAVLRRRGRPDLAVSAVPAAEADPTGAGDVFAATLVVALWEGQPPEEAARLAAAAAAISVESAGAGGVPTRKAAEARLSAAPAPRAS